MNRPGILLFNRYASDEIDVNYNNNNNYKELLENREEGASLWIYKVRVYYL